jgi:hypothetical protein
MTIISWLTINGCFCGGKVAMKRPVPAAISSRGRNDSNKPWPLFESDNFLKKISNLQGEAQ